MKSPKRNPCPVSGDYTGYIPDATGLCAKLSSDCNNPDIMFYTVSNCATKSEVYEGERSQRLLWMVHTKWLCIRSAIIFGDDLEKKKAAGLD